MFSFRSVTLISSCAVGVGYFLGKVNNSNNNDNGGRPNTQAQQHSHAQCHRFINPNEFGRNLNDEDYEQKVSNCSNFSIKKLESDRSHLFNFIPTATVHAKSEFPVSTINQQAQTKAGELVRYGFPSTDNLRSYEDFILSYDKRTRVANWVLEHLTPEKVNRQEGADRSKMKFQEDNSVHNFHRATNKDYQGSGYDRGHLAAAANHRQSQSAMSQTFILSNIAPQVGEGFNRDAWNNLEKYVRAIARKAKNVYVCTGPLYLPRKEPDGKLYIKYEVIGANNVAVPTHFFKVVVIENEPGQFDLQSYVMPNQPLPNVKVQSYLMPLEMIERAAGLNFFQNIPKTSFRKINSKSTS